METYLFEGEIRVIIETSDSQVRGPNGIVSISPALADLFLALLSVIEESPDHIDIKTILKKMPGIKGDALHTRMCRFREKLRQVGAMSILPDRAWALQGYKGKLSKTPLADLLNWIAPENTNPKILIALGTRNHRRFRSWKKEVAEHYSTEKVEAGVLRGLDVMRQQIASDSYRALATDGAYVADIASVIARNRKDACIRSLPDIEVLSELSKGEVNTIISLGMGNVNSVSQWIVQQLSKWNVQPRPLDDGSNGLNGYSGKPSPDMTGQSLGCVVAYEIPPGELVKHSVRLLLAAGVDAIGTQAASRLILDLLTGTWSGDVRKWLERCKFGGILLLGHPRAGDYYVKHGKQTLYADNELTTGISFNIVGLDEDEPYTILFPPSDDGVVR